jgi:hypothetical protein
MSAVAPVAGHLDRERIFYTAMTVSMAVLVFVGFARTFYLRIWFPEVPAPPEPIFLYHGALFSAWMILLVVQSSLIATGNVRLHRTLGTGGVVLAAVMVVMGISTAMVAAQRPGGFISAPVPPLQFLIVPFLDAALFGACVALAAWWRRIPQTHKRLMLVATINMLTAAAARIPLALTHQNVLAAFIIADLFIVALLLWDLKTLGRPHRVTLWAGGITILSQPLRLVISETAAWQAFAAWVLDAAG